jgi:hypothetical protein
MFQATPTGCNRSLRVLSTTETLQILTSSGETIAWPFPASINLPLADSNGPKGTGMSELRAAAAERVHSRDSGVPARKAADALHGEGSARVYLTGVAADQQAEETIP